jgi:OmpA-OmpF porin, OOP family
MTFVLADNTEVSEVGRLSNATKKQMAMNMLIPGLKVKVEGNYNEARQVVAASIKFKHDDLEQAQSVQAGMHEVKVQNQEQQNELERQNAEMKAQNEALQKHQTELEEHQKQIAANTARFGELDDWYILDELTIYFGNGKVNLDPQYESQLLALAEKAKTIDGYAIEVRGYASSAGRESLNKKLSEERARNVTNILLQKGTHSVHADGCPRCAGRGTSSRKQHRQAGRGGKPSRRRALTAEQSSCRKSQPGELNS